MNRVQVGTLIFLSISILYSFLFYRIVNVRKFSYSRQLIAAAPGFLLIFIIYTWLVLKFSIGQIFFLTLLATSFGVLYAIGIKITADWLGKIPEFARWRKEMIEKRIARRKSRGKNAVEMQDRGILPDNDKLKEYGFSDFELIGLGLTQTDSPSLKQEPPGKTTDLPPSASAKISGTREAASLIGTIVISVIVAMLLAAIDLADSTSINRVIAIVLFSALFIGIAIFLHTKQRFPYAVVLIIYLVGGGFTLFLQFSKLLIFLLPR